MPGLWLLRLPTPWPTVPTVNAYVIEGADGIVLVDCGGGGHSSTVDAVAAAIAQTGWRLDDVRELVITHYHTDHMGCAATIGEQTGCRVSGHPATAHGFDAVVDPSRVYAEREALAVRAGVPHDLLPVFASVDEEVYGCDGPLELDVRLVDGVTIDTSLGQWEVLETPGHAPSEVSLWQADHRVLLAGDVLAPVFVPYFDIGFTPDPAGELLASLRALRALDASLALPGHGRVIEAVDASLDEHVTALCDGLDECERALRKRGPSTSFELMTLLHPDWSHPMRVAWRSTIATAYLEHLVASGRASSGDEDGVRRYAAVGVPGR